MTRRAIEPAGASAAPARPSAPARRGSRARAVPSATALRLRIGRLVLDGSSRADGARVRTALAAHLAELVEGAPGLDWTRVRSLGRLDGGTVPPRATPDEIGRHLAARIFRGLMRDV